MTFYIIENKDMPWGDYGDILFGGLLTVMDDDFNDIDIHKIERTGPYIPEIYKANSTNLVIDQKVNDLFFKNQITGIDKILDTELVKLVNIDWESWEFKNEDPEFYPESEEPIDYIEEGLNDEKLHDNLGKYYSLKIVESCELEEVKEDSFVLKGTPKHDIFIPINMNFIIVSEKFKNLLDKENISTLKYLKLG